MRNVYCYKCLVRPEVGSTPVEKCFDTKTEAIEDAVYEYNEKGEPTKVEISEKTKKNRKCKRDIRDDVWNAYKISVVLACHFGKADITTLEYKESHQILRYAAEVQGGIVTMMPKPTICKSVYNVSKHPQAYLISLNLADTMCHTAASRKSLADLGAACEVPKIELPENVKSEMLTLLKRDPKLYAKYAVNDAVICVEYLRSIYGENKKPPVTMTSGGCKITKERMIEYFKKTDKEFNEKDFDKVYCGIEIVKDGLKYDEDKAAFLQETKSRSLSPSVALIHDYATQAYCGGYNYCNEVGFYILQTDDYDLCSAYPSAMGLIPDVDWKNPISLEVKSLDGNPFSIDLSYWRVSQLISNHYEPYRLIFADVREFEFPKDVLYPTIGVRDDGITVYPRTYSDHSHALCASGPELYLALRLGAKIKVNQLIVLNPKLCDDGTVSNSMGYASKQLQADRAKAKRIFGKGSLPEQILKTINNSMYGKISQNVQLKQKYNAKRDEMDFLTKSSITNPVNACYITSMIRCVLLAAQNQLHELGYKVFSVTTDGFISNAPELAVHGLDLYGFRDAFIYSANRLLGMDPNRKIWEIKHRQNDLLNFTTRGNVSLIEEVKDTHGKVLVQGGVCAHAGTKSPYKEDSYKDRSWLFHGVLSREGKMPYISRETTKFKDLIKGKQKDYDMYDKPKNVSVDFDCKRKPVRESIQSVDPVLSPVDGNCYTLANFETEPYETLTEYLQYRRALKVCKVLRTEEDWDRFYKALNDVQSGKEIQRVRRARTSLKGLKDPEWNKVWACAVKHRQCGDEYKIPYVSVLEKRRGSVNKIVDFFNKFNHGEHKMTANNWKDARKPDRLKNVLPDELTKDLRQELQKYQCV